MSPCRILPLRTASSRARGIDAADVLPCRSTVTISFSGGSFSFFAVLFTGRWPEGLRTFVVGYFRWTMRVYAYLYFLTDAYPPFNLQ